MLLLAPFASAETVTFSGTVQHQCVLVVNTQPTLDYDYLDATRITTDAAGVTGDVNVSTTTHSVFKLVLVEETAFDTSPSLTFTPQFYTSGYIYNGTQSGQSLVTDGNGNLEKALDGGSQNVYISMTANSPAGQIFPAGYYEANTTISCVAIP